MNQDDYKIETNTTDWKALLEASTPYVYRRNAFRITGLPADVSIRDIKRRIDDLKHAEEIGDVEDEHSHAFALTPPPTIEHIREAALSLQDPELRIVQEFYWFWPMEWGKGKTDPAFVALSKGNKTAAFNIWKQALHGPQLATMIISKHNLAVFYQIVALDNELSFFRKNPTEEALKLIDKYWHYSFNFWKEIIEENLFWDLVANRILAAADPRLTAELSANMRTTLPKALHKINGQLALMYIENGNLDLAGKHAIYMAETYQGLTDDVSATFNLITEPIQMQIRDAVAIATRIAERQPDKAAEAANDLFKTVIRPLEILKSIPSLKDHILIDLLDAVAEAGLLCGEVYAREQKGWKQGLLILEKAQTYAMSIDVSARISKQYSLLKEDTSLRSIIQMCEEVSGASKKSPENAISEGNRLLTIARPLIAELDMSDAHDNVKNRAKDEVAGTLAQCAIDYGNKTGEWKSSIGLLETAQQLAVSVELKEFIDRNLQISRQNVKFAGLESISEAPSLSRWNGIGFHLYGSTDHDADTKSYLSTYYFVIFLIPFFPICRYRVIPIDNGYRFLGKAPLRRFDKILPVIFWLLTGFIIFNIANNEPVSSSQYRSTPPTTKSNVTSPPQSYDNRSARTSLRTEIENGKRRAKEMESQIRDMDSRLEDYERKLNYYRSTKMVNEYNMLVPTFNALVQQRKALFQQYDLVINDVNSKVNSYNAGSR